MWEVIVFVYSSITFIESLNVNMSQDNTAVLISKYSKVARWGVTGNGTLRIQEGRSSNHQTPWIQRSDANIIGGGQGMKTESRVPYRYYSEGPSKADSNNKVEKIPAVQDRFNPRPYFDYGKIPTKSDTATYDPAQQVVAVSASAQTPAPSPASNTGFNSFPAVFNVAPSTPKSVDLYTSPYSSYNPPPLRPENAPIPDLYPPSSQEHYPAALSFPMKDGEGYHYKLSSKSPYVSLGPPLAYQNDQDDSASPNNNHDVDAPPSDHTHEHAADSPPYSDGEGEIYYPPHSSDVHTDVILENPPMNYKPADLGMGSDSNMNTAMDMDGNMASPALNGYHVPHFPQYLYDGHHYDDHVYEEIPRTTTEAMEDKRVSGGQYSYYYLGRKLWYIPLYFSIYFIIYVTVLILKAIARHKIQYKHKWVTSSRSGRKIIMPIDGNGGNIDDLHERVNKAFDKAKRMYTTFAM